MGPFLLGAISMSECNLKEYLGDGVYGEWHMQGGTLVLTTENGMAITNTIYLTPEILTALNRFISRMDLHPENEQ